MVGIFQSLHQRSLIKKERQYVDFKDVKEEIEIAIENFTEAVDSKGIDCKTGFPANVKSAGELPRMKKYKHRSKKLREEKIKASYIQKLQSKEL